MAKIDVLLPIYNAASTLAEAVKSLQNQTFRDFRLIAIDDGSTDESGEILRELARHDERIEILSMANGGIVDALNAGLRLSTAEYVARQDADDISDPARLQLELAYLEQHPECVAVSGTVTYIDGAGMLTGQVQFFQPDDADAKWLPSREPYLSHPFLMVRRTAFDSIGGYRHVNHSEDTDLYWRLRQHGTLHSLDRSLGFYRMHSNSISSRSIINGRIAALSSQLASLSAIRRSEGREDLSFPRNALARYQAARTLEKIVELGGEGLTDGESLHLRIATSLKLLEVATYRPYRLDGDDCRYIRHSVSLMSDELIENKAAIDHLIAKNSARLLTKGLFREAGLLTPRRVYLSIVPRLIYDVMPRRLRKTLADLRT